MDQIEDPWASVSVEGPGLKHLIAVVLLVSATALTGLAIFLHELHAQKPNDCVGHYVSLLLTVPVLLILAKCEELCDGQQLGRL